MKFIEGGFKDLIINDFIALMASMLRRTILAAFEFGFDVSHRSRRSARHVKRGFFK
jgi:hypothetical protein